LTLDCETAAAVVVQP